MAEFYDMVDFLESLAMEARDEGHLGTARRIDDAIDDAILTMDEEALMRALRFEIWDRRNRWKRP